MTDGNLKKYIYNFNWLALEKILRLIFGFFIGIWLARYLGPEAFGMLSYAQAITGILIAFVTLGFGPIITRDILSKKYKLNTLLVTSILFQVVSSILIILTIGIYTFNVDNSMENILIFIISLSFIFQSFNSFDSYYQAKSLNKFSSLSNIISFSISAGLKVFLILNEYELVYFAIVSIIESFFLSLLYLYFYKKKEKLFVLDIKKEIGFSLLKDSWPLMPHKIALVLIANIDMIMIAKMVDSYSVGIYAIAYKIFLIVSFMSSILTRLFFPALVGKSDLSHRFIKFYRTMFILSIIGMLLYFLVGKYLIILAFGEQYIDSIKVLDVLMLSIVFVFLNAVCDQWYVIQNYTKAFLYRTVIASFLNIVLNYYFITNFGYIGAAYATFITMFYLAYFSNFYKKDFRMNLSLIHQAIFFWLKGK